LKAGGECLITADHGNVELMVNPETGGAVTSHTVFPVPLVYVSGQTGGVSLKEGRLADIAPTLLTMMQLDVPAEMTGTNLIQR
jgi:2,3-bisphosphoglycerate-independent phosphoglycerate mutase